MKELDAGGWLLVCVRERENVCMRMREWTERKRPKGITVSVANGGLTVKKREGEAFFSSKEKDVSGVRETLCERERERERKAVKIILKPAAAIKSKGSL